MLLSYLRQRIKRGGSLGLFPSGEIDEESGEREDE
jgi:hypothetical protein